MLAPQVYGKEAVPQMEEILARADTLAAFGIHCFAPIGRKGLAAALSGARVMLYRGDLGEAFCLALAEVQAMGVPAVAKALGSAAERVIDGTTGCIAEDDDEFAAAPSRRSAMTDCGGAGTSPLSPISAD